MVSPLPDVFIILNAVSGALDIYRLTLASAIQVSGSYVQLVSGLAWVQTIL